MANVPCLDTQPDSYCSGGLEGMVQGGMKFQSKIKKQYEGSSNAGPD